MLRHGQCCHEGERDELKELTQHGHKQAEDSIGCLALPQQLDLSLESFSPRVAFGLWIRGI